ncbi:MFS transporter [Shinella yambaruensis]|uniref:MFS transporter n=1 Tax=Shinella yambaruensis TaxID=415996 RepID=UPI001FD60404|nr:MFS transporter [Shinella yambaruensis]MCJ8028368.1 MFS transporter [Shinella yambaruensis]MCU7981421.1 MFS transporter [Shinella yambaruensis]
MPSEVEEAPFAETSTNTFASGRITLKHWLAVMSIAVVSFMMVTTEYLPVGLIPSMAADLGVTHGVAGLTVTVPALVAAFGALLVSVLASRFDRRIVLTGLTVMLVAANAIAVLAPSFAVLVAGRVLVGVALGGFWTIGIAVGPRLMPEPTGTRGTTVIFSGISLGTIAGVPAGTLIGDLLGWRAAFGAAGAVTVVALVALAVFVPPLPANHRTRWRDLPALLSVSQARLGLLLAALTFGGVFFAYPYIAPFLAIVSGMGPAGINVMLLVFGGAGFFGNIIGGWMAGRSNRLAMAVTSITLATPVFLLAAYGESKALTSLLVCIWGLAYGALSITCQSWVARAAPGEIERGAALFVATIEIAVAFGAWIGGEVVDTLGVATTMIVSGAVVMLATPLSLVFGRLPRR